MRTVKYSLAIITMAVLVSDMPAQAQSVTKQLRRTDTVDQAVSEIDRKSGVKNDADEERDSLEGLKKLLKSYRGKRHRLSAQIKKISSKIEGLSNTTKNRHLYEKQRQSIADLTHNRSVLEARLEDEIREFQLNLCKLSHSDSKKIYPLMQIEEDRLNKLIERVELKQDRYRELYSKSDNNRRNPNWRKKKRESKKQWEKKSKALLAKYRYELDVERDIKSKVNEIFYKEARKIANAIVHEIEKDENNSFISFALEDYLQSNDFNDVAIRYIGKILPSSGKGYYGKARCSVKVVHKDKRWLYQSHKVIVLEQAVNTITVTCPHCRGSGLPTYEDIREWERQVSVMLGQDIHNTIRMGPRKPTVCPKCNGAGTIEVKQGTTF